jgi:hypothetical protein
MSEYGTVDQSAGSDLPKDDDIFQRKIMVHRGVEKKLDRRRKLVVCPPEDILKRDIGKSFENERGIPNVYRFSP